MNLKRMAVVIVTAVTMGFAFFAAPLASAATTTQSSTSAAANQVCAGIAATGSAGCNGSDTSLNSIIGIAINIFSIIIGITAVIMIMTAGFKYITSNGDSGQIGSAKNTLIYSIIGLIIVALAQSIVHFVLNRVTSAK